MKEIMNPEQLSRTLKRMTHEIIERNQDLESIVLVGIMHKGVPMAKMLKSNLQRFANLTVELIELDITPYRDDCLVKEHFTKEKGFDVNQKNVILVDDVLFTGRSVRAAMDAISHHGRPNQIQLAILIDRGHRELPIKADYIGKHVPTSSNEKVFVDFEKGFVNIL
jgi:pyrimidine operon attenuation protein / uracil phosphoribosyltransferase